MARPAISRKCARPGFRRCIVIRASHTRGGIRSGSAALLNIDGVIVRPGDLLQVDQHGALIVPVETLPHLEEAILEIERRERLVIDYARSGTATRAGLVEAVTRHLLNAPAWTPKS